MAARSKTTAAPARRTPVAEWIAAALGMVLTLSVVGYLLSEGLTEHNGAPALSVAAEAPEPAAGGFAVPLTVRNDSDATAADVEVRGALAIGGRVVEERRTRFAYVPGGGEAKGGLIFQQNPLGGSLSVVAEGYEEP